MLSYGEVKRYIPTPFHSTNRVSVARLMLCIVCGPCFTAASARVCSICAAITYYIALAHRRNTYAQLEETVPTRAQYFTLWMADWNDSKFHSPLSRVMQSCSEQIGSQNPMIFSHGVGKSKIKSQYVYIYISILIRLIKPWKLKFRKKGHLEHLKVPISCLDLNLHQVRLHTFILWQDVA